MGLFPSEVTNNIKEVLEEYQLLRLDENQYDAVEKGFSISYMGKKIEL